MLRTGIGMLLHVLYKLLGSLRGVSFVITMRIIYTKDFYSRFLEVPVR